MTFPRHDHAARRRRALEILGERGALVLPAAPEVLIGRDTDVPYAPDANLLYLTGCVEPGAVAVIAPGASGGPFVLFVPERDEDAERWTGPRESPAAIGERLGADTVHPTAALRDRLPRLLAGADTIHFPIGWGRPDVERFVLDIMIAARRTRQRKGRGPRALVDPGAVLDDLRLIKDDAELARIRAAADITVEAFREAAVAARSADGEWQVQAAVEHGFRRRRASGPAFATIAAAGANATVLHYSRNQARLAPADLLLLDAGCTVDHYHADVTRTWSLGGAPSEEQRAMHEIVMRAHGAAIDAVRPGATEADVHRAALAELLGGMHALGLIEDEPDAALAAEDERLRARPSESEPPSASAPHDKPKRPAWARFFPHRVSHWLGLEVHDVGDYARDGEPRVLRSGMVLTIEPGLYVPGEDPQAPEAFRGLGVRIEDDILVTETGRDVLTDALPRALDLP